MWIYPLPRCYAVSFEDDDGSPTLVYKTWGGDPCRVYRTRETSLAFAKDIAGGWLDDLAAWLEARTTESAEAVATLERAAEAMR